MNRSYALLLALALLQGCQSLAPQSREAVAPAADVTPAQPAAPVVYGSFSQETLYSLLTGSRGAV